MTIEDIATKICDKYSLTIDLSIPIEDAIKHSQRWIPIDEKFPPRNVKLLFKNNNNRVEYGCFDFTYTDLVNHYKYWRLIELT